MCSQEENEEMGGGDHIEEEGGSIRVRIEKEYRGYL